MAVAEAASPPPAQAQLDTLLTPETQEELRDAVNDFMRQQRAQTN
jgi:hypothetical protein